MLKKTKYVPVLKRHEITAYMEHGGNYYSLYTLALHEDEYSDSCPGPFIPG
jgi:hypothetical protein